MIIYNMPTIVAIAICFWFVFAIIHDLGKKMSGGNPKRVKRHFDADGVDENGYDRYGVRVDNEKDRERARQIDKEIRERGGLEKLKTDYLYF